MNGQSGSKVMGADEAVRRFLQDGDCFALGGFVTNRRPYGLVREIVRQKKRGLYAESGSAGGDLDMLIGAGCVRAVNISYIANSGFTQVCRRFREAVEQGTILFEDYSLDVQTIAYHGAALGLSYVPVRNMLGSDLTGKWGIDAAARRAHPKLPAQKFIIQEDPFHPGATLCCVPTPTIDAAFLHVQKASPDGLCRIEGPVFQDLDIAIAAKHTVVSCEELVPDEELRGEPHLNSLPGLCVDAVVHLPNGAHPAQCYGYYDYDSRFYLDYDQASRTQAGFTAFLEEYVLPHTHESYLHYIGPQRLEALNNREGFQYVPGMERK